jgi:hypothetical protein
MDFFIASAKSSFEHFVEAVAHVSTASGISVSRVCVAVHGVLPDHRCWQAYQAAYMVSNALAQFRRGNGKFAPLVSVCFHILRLLSPYNTEHTQRQIMPQLIREFNEANGGDYANTFEDDGYTLKFKGDFAAFVFKHDMFKGETGATLYDAVFFWIVVERKNEAKMSKTKKRKGQPGKSGAVDRVVIQAPRGQADNPTMARRQKSHVVADDNHPGQTRDTVSCGF